MLSATSEKGQGLLEVVILLAIVAGIIFYVLSRMDASAHGIME